MGKIKAIASSIKSVVDTAYKSRKVVKTVAKEITKPIKSSIEKGLAIGSAVGTAIGTSIKNRQTKNLLTTSQQNQNSNTNTLIQCVYCRKFINKNSNFCMYCGKQMRK